MKTLFMKNVSLIIIIFVCKKPHPELLRNINDTLLQPSRFNFLLTILNLLCMVTTNNLWKIITYQMLVADHNGQAA